MVKASFISCFCRIVIFVNLIFFQINVILRRNNLKIWKFEFQISKWQIWIFVSEILQKDLILVKILALKACPLTSTLSANSATYRTVLFFSNSFLSPVIVYIRPRAISGINKIFASNLLRVLTYPRVFR